MTTKSPRLKRRRPAHALERKSVINRLLESKLIRRLSYEEYRTKVRGVYAGRLRNASQVENLTANLISVNRRYKAHAGIRVTDI